MSGKNTIKRSVRQGSMAESSKAFLTSTISYNQGDLLVMDTSAHTIRKASTESEMNQFMGIARETVVNGVIPRPYTTDVDASAAIADVAGPIYGITALAQLKASDTLNPGDVVYAYTTQGPRVVSASGTKVIGIYQGATVTGAPSASPTEVEVLFGHRYPADTLVF